MPQDTLSIEERLHDAINKYRREMWGAYPHFILMHGKTFNELEHELYESYRGLSSVSSYHDKQFIFMGIQVIRTYDIPEGEIFFAFNDIERLRKLK